MRRIPSQFILDIFNTHIIFMWRYGMWMVTKRKARLIFSKERQSSGLIVLLCWDHRFNLRPCQSYRKSLITIRQLDGSLVILNFVIIQSQLFFLFQNKRTSYPILRHDLYLFFSLNFYAIMLRWSSSINYSNSYLIRFNWPHACQQ